MEKLKYWKKYHGIELFGYILGGLLFCILIDFIAIGIHMKNVDADVLTEKAIYTPTFITSLSGTTGSVVDVYVNEDNTKCAIMLFIDNVNQTSIDANDYRLFYKGFNVSKGAYAKTTKNHPSGGYYIFGSTGYAMIYLVDNAGFQQQAAEIVVRSNTTLVETENEQTLALRALNGSYSNYDQFRIVVNPAGTAAQKVDFLGSGDDFNIDQLALYQNSVINAKEDAQRQILKDDVKQLNDYYKQINNYKKNLQSLGVNVPDISEQILGDEFETVDVPNDDPNLPSEQMLVYRPSYVFPDGVDYNWFTNSLHDMSFLDDFIAKSGRNQSSGFFDMLKLNKDPAIDTISESRTWTKIDGTVIESSDTSSSDVAQMDSNIKLYVTAYNNYITLKHSYQSSHLVNYLLIDEDIRTSGSISTSHLDSDFEKDEKTGEIKIDEETGEPIVYPIVTVW